MFTALRKLFIFMFVFLLALTFTPIVRAQGPDPEIMAIVIPSTIEKPGQPFEVTVWAANRGGDGKGSISISFPDNPVVQIVDHDATGEGEWTPVFHPGDSITKFPTLEKTTAQYPLTETWHPHWSEGETHFLTVRVIPSAAASVTRVYIRVALADAAGRFYLAPAESTVSDQQGFPVEVREVRVAPTSTPTPIPPTATRIPTLTLMPPMATPIPTAMTMPPAATPTYTRTPMPPTVTPTSAPTSTSPARPIVDPGTADIIVAIVGAVGSIIVAAIGVKVALAQSKKGKDS